MTLILIKSMCELYLQEYTTFKLSVANYQLSQHETYPS